MAGAISVAALTAPSAASAASVGSAPASPAFARLEAVTQQRSSQGATQQVGTLRETQFSQGTRRYAAKEAIAREQAAARERAAAKARAAAKERAAAKRAAERKQAADRKARAAAVKKQAATATSATALSGSPRQVAQTLLGQFGWSGSQFSCLEPLWGHESGWNVSASNPSSGAYGIPQALPGSRMASAGPDWQSSAATQIEWGLRYIQSTYGSPCAAWSHEQSAGWY